MKRFWNDDLEAAFVGIGKIQIAIVALIVKKIEYPLWCTESVWNEHDCDAMSL
jgi:hypothetical protein